MPKQLALLLCSLFVFYLLKCDSRQANRASWVLWIPTLWMLAIATKSLDYWFGVTGGSSESGGLVDPLFQSTVLCLGLIIIVQRKLNWAWVFQTNTWLIVLIGYMLISIVWSDMPFISFKRWVKELTAVVMALLILTEAAPEEALQSLLRRTVYVLIPFSILLVKYYPQTGVVFGRWSGDQQWIGVTLQKNALGRLCLTAAFFLIWTFVRRRKKKDIAVGKYQTQAEVFLLLITFWLLKGPSMWAASATALYALGLGLITFFALLWMKKHKIQLGVVMWVAIVACIIGVGIITPLVGGSNLASFTSVVGRDATFTGRTEIWQEYLPSVMRQPIFGYGFGGFYKVPAEAHNGYLDIWLGLGFVGVIITAMFLLSGARKAALLLPYDFDWACLCLCFLLMAAIHNISESSFDSFQRQLMATVLFLTVVVPAGAQSRRISEMMAARESPATLNPQPSVGFI